MTLRGLPLVLQAALGDGLAFDPFSLQQDCLAASELDVGRCVCQKARFGNNGDEGRREAVAM